MIFPLYFVFIYASTQAHASTFDKCIYDQEGEITRHFYVDEYDLPIRIEVSSRTSHQLVSHILRILLNEVVGYPHVYLFNHDEAAGDATRTLQKISSCYAPGNCSAVDVYGPEIMINVEVWLVPGFNLEGWISTGQVDVLGPLGPVGRSGWYIPAYIVKYFWESNNTVIDHWRAFTLPEVVKHFELSEDELNELMGGKRYCFLKECGEDGIYRPKKCQQEGVQCATLLADFPASNIELLKNEITSLGLLVNIAWIGEQLKTVVEKRTTARKYTLFFHRMPMALSSIETFSHVSFPNCEDSDYTSCDFEINQLEKLNIPHLSNLNNSYLSHLSITFDDIPITVSARASLNLYKGSDEFLMVSDAEFVSELEAQQVIAARRITLKRDGQIIPTRHVILTFDTPVLPKKKLLPVISVVISDLTYQILFTASNVRDLDTLNQHAMDLLLSVPAVLNQDMKK
ncbi:hypothetical protein AVEN_92644-1 [Araneus ventricosus]|uniref:Uncharacterized protein n=1 Tax=Araneus ventricosus TaxID=182803 RepID=A0A4Y2AI81_ARAVE|nr:hypothetical protein AVEN_92644-1 [Araneus ventricosus]